MKLFQVVYQLYIMVINGIVEGDACIFIWNVTVIVTLDSLCVRWINQVPLLI
jgi:hypothetical protein